MFNDLTIIPRANGLYSRPKKLDKSRAALAQRMQASGESASTIATTLGVSCAAEYRVSSPSK